MIRIRTISEAYATIPNAKSIPQHVWDIILPLECTTMYELGNKKTSDVTYKSVFTGAGIDHVSIDFNGLDGALKLNLLHKIDLPSRDVLTNIGTTEHVHPDQEMCFRNVHNLSHGRMIHCVPYGRTMLHHGIFGYDLGFFELLAKANNYVIEKMYMLERLPGYRACVSLRKTNNDEFRWIGPTSTLHSKQRVSGMIFRFMDDQGKPIEPSQTFGAPVNVKAVPVQPEVEAPKAPNRPLRPAAKRKARLAGR